MPHIVDLDGAVPGNKENKKSIEKILKLKDKVKFNRRRYKKYR